MPLINVPAMLVKMPGGHYEEFPLIKHHYFKVPHASGRQLISGLPLPEPGKKYYFQNCTFHPGLKEELEKKYNDSIFVDCDKD